MFEKLVSVLPFNPSAAHQLSFYARRMKEESAIRRTGLIFIVLAFLVQFFVVLSPSQPTVADSTNDLINGGFTSITEAAHDCASDPDYATILSNYGITCSDVNAGHTVTIKSTDFGGQLYSVGYNPLGTTNPSTHKPTNETPASLLGLSRPIYWRLLDNWDSGASSTYQMIQVTSSVSHQTFYLMYRCGNLVHVGVPPARPVCQYNHGVFQGTAQCFQPCPTNSAVANGSPACHPALCPADHSIYVTDSGCKTCQYDSTIIKANPKCVQCTNPHFPTISNSNPSCVPVCKYNNIYNQGDSQCKPCTSSTGSADTQACVIPSKSATDITQGWTTTSNSPKDAQPNDTIVYTLTAKNEGKATDNNFTMQENINDVLDYANLVSYDGGSYDQATGEITWPTTDIKAETSLVHTVTVKVKATIPSTPASISDPGHFDSTMTNVYGNTVNITVPKSVIKTVAVVTTTQLPNTGPGTSMIAIGAIMVIAGYFYSRSRLLAKEAKIVLQSTSGGF